MRYEFWLTPMLTAMLAIGGLLMAASVAAADAPPFHEQAQVLYVKPPSDKERARSIELGLSQLQHSNPRLRASGISLLSSYGAREHIGDILPLLQDVDAAVRANAVTAVQRLGGEGYLEDIVPRLHDEGSYACGAFPETDPPCVVQAAAVTAVGELGGHQHAGHIADLLDHGSARVREQALRALGTLGSQEFMERIAARLSDADTRVRFTAVEMLATLEGHDYANAIAQLLQDSEDLVQYQAAKALAQLGAREHAADIAQLLDAPRPNRVDPRFLKYGESAKGMAVQALGRLGAKEYETKIAALLQYNDHFVSASAANVLSDWGLAEKYGISPIRRKGYPASGESDPGSAP